MPTSDQTPANEGVDPRKVPHLTDMTERLERQVEDFGKGIEEGAERAKEEVDHTAQSLRNLKGADASTARAQAMRDAADRKVREKAFKTDEEGFVMPELEELVEASKVAKTLDDDELEAAYTAAQDLDFTDAIGMMNFGLDEQNKASTVARDFIEEFRDADLEELTRLANESNRRMEELNIGDLKPGFWAGVVRRIMPARQAAAVESFLQKHKDLSEMLDGDAVAMASEKVELQEYYERVDAKIAENERVHKALGKKIAEAELSYGINEKRVAEVKREHEERVAAGKADPLEARKIAMYDDALTRQRRRINTLMAMRQVMLQSMRKMDLLKGGILSQMQMIDEQVTFNRTVWDNAVLEVATTNKVKNSIDAVEYKRKQVEKMLRESTDNMADTLNALLKSQGEGVVNAAVLEYAAQQVMRMNRDRIEGAKMVREKLRESDDVIQRMEDFIENVTAASAAMTDEDIAKLRKTLEDADIADSKGDQGEEKEA